MQTQDKLSDRQLSDEQSREVAETIREEIARRRISRQALAEQAKLSLSTLEKALGGRRPFTLATTVRLEQALGVSLRKSIVVPAPAVGSDVAPDSLGSYSHRAVTWIEGVYITLRPSFGDKDAIFAYRTEIVWEPKVSSLVFREGERTDERIEAHSCSPSLFRHPSEGWGPRRRSCSLDETWMPASAGMTVVFHRATH